MGAYDLNDLIKDMSEKVFDDFLEWIDDEVTGDDDWIQREAKEHLLYIEVGQLNYGLYIFGGEQ